MIGAQERIVNITSSYMENYTKERLQYYAENSEVVCSERNSDTLIELRKLTVKDEYFVVFSDEPMPDEQRKDNGEEMVEEYINGTVFFPVTDSLPDAILDYSGCNRWVSTKRAREEYAEKLKEIEERYHDDFLTAYYAK